MPCSCSAPASHCSDTISGAACNAGPDPARQLSPAVRVPPQFRWVIVDHADRAHEADGIVEAVFCLAAESALSLLTGLSKGDQTRTLGYGIQSALGQSVRHAMAERCKDMQDNLSTTPTTETPDTTQIAKLAKIADSHALLFDFVLGPDGLGYILRDGWTGVTDCGPTTLPEIAIHLGHYQDQRERE